MKLTSLFAVSLVCLATNLAPTFANADDLEPSMQQVAEKTMLKTCSKEFPDYVGNFTTAQIDKWVNSQEDGLNADLFKRSKCYSSHVAWEKIAPTSEYASNNTSTPDRMPASK